MRAIDASSIVYGWDNYPPDQFPRLWDWLATEISSGQLVIASVALEEVEHVAPDCAKWLKDASVRQLGIGNAEVTKALEIQKALGVSDGDFHPKGVDENDILIISSAQTNGMPLITNEGRQDDLPGDMKKYKIPAVCGLPGVNVATMSFVEYIKQSKEVFG